MKHRSFRSLTSALGRLVAKSAAVAAHGVVALLLLAALPPLHAQPPDSYTITTAAGAARAPLADSAPALETVLEEPSGLVVDDDGHLYITEFSRFAVWKLDESGTLTRVAGNGGRTPGVPGMLAPPLPLALPPPLLLSFFPSCGADVFTKDPCICCWNTQKLKKIKGAHTTTSKYRLINYAYFRPHQRISKSKFWLNSYNI